MAGMTAAQWAHEIAEILWQWSKRIITAEERTARIADANARLAPPEQLRLDL